MAELFLAKDTLTQELVVIKRILPYLSHEAEFVQMFLDEARIAAQLHHPNIIQVHELGALEDSIFIAMEYVDGVDLRKVLQEESKAQRTVPYAFAAFIVSQVCAGLHYAHNKVGRDGKPMGIIHRDVSPQNVMVGFSGAIKLVDFGIAKAGALVERSKPGIIKGKFLYLSPEQLSQDRVDHRADLFALGTMLYEVTTGKSPFYKPTTEAVIYAIRAEEPPPPHLVRSNYPEALSQVVMKCLTKDREKRYQQAGEVQQALEQYLRADAPTTADDLVQYVGHLFSADERTLLVAPGELSGEKLADEPIDNRPTKPMMGASQDAPPVGRRPTPEAVPAVATDTEEPRTQTARPEDLARAFGPEVTPATSKPPARRISGLKYQPAGTGEEDPTTTAPTDERLRPGSDSVLSATPSDSTPSAFTPSTDREAPARRPRKAPGDQPVFDPPSEPGAPDLGAEPSTRPARPGAVRREEAEPTASVVQRRPDVLDRVRVMAQNPVALGVGAFLLVLVLGILIVSWIAPDPQPVPEPLPDDAPARQPEPKAAKQPERPAEPPKQEEPAQPPPEPTAAIPDAGSQAPEPPSLVTVVFRAPPGTRIQRLDDSGYFTPGVKYLLHPGPQRIVVRCPAKRGRKPAPARLEVKIASPRSGTQKVTLCRR